MAGHSKYDGNILLNSRTIINCAETLKQNRSSEYNRNNIHGDQFIEFLMLIECLIIGNTLFYDGTAGGSVMKDLSIAEEYIESNTDHPDAESLLTKAQPKSQKETLRFCEKAASLGEISMRQGIESELFLKKGGFDLESFQIEIENFKNEWTSLPNTPEKLRERANETISAQKYRGAKCVAGILLNSAQHIEDGRAGVPIASLCANLILDMRNLDEVSRMLDYLMNEAFRPNLLPSLASDLCEASFFAHEGVANNSKNFHFAYTSYIAKSMFHDSARLEFCVNNLAAELGVKDEPIPWLGLLCFLNAEGSTPFAVFEHALEDRRLLSNLFKSVDTEFSMNGAFIEDNMLADQTAKEFVFGRYKKLYGFGKEASEGKNQLLEVGARFSPGNLSQLTLIAGETLKAAVSREAVEFITPDILAGPVQTVLSGMPNEAGSLSRYFQLDHVHDAIRKLRFAFMNDRQKNLITVHSKLRTTFNQALTSQTDLKHAVDEKVEQLFGAKLDWATLKLNVN